MKNRDIIELFDLVPPYTPVDVVEFGVSAGPWAEIADVARQVRDTVFVVEQKVPVDIEHDENDAVSHHVIATDSMGNPIGTGRLLPDGHIGRMAVLAAQRGSGVGRALLERLLEEARLTGKKHLALNSQVQACGFYRRFGFVADGPEFMEAGIAHQTMVRDS
ncbi:MAG: GNAT family N-acetyltransferase [Burkholderiaceae bacterium]|nr:GNAT family N-acetyltransferase [Sulfuritalea sp.]MCF8176731.1 GNAT family N-acetyltransferase [Burkholderiaceae bacterium]